MPSGESKRKVGSKRKRCAKRQKVIKKGKRKAKAQRHKSKEVKIRGQKDTEEREEKKAGGWGPKASAAEQKRGPKGWSGGKVVKARSGSVLLMAGPHFGCH